MWSPLVSLGPGSAHEAALALLQRNPTVAAKLSTRATTAWRGQVMLGVPTDQLRDSFGSFRVRPGGSMPRGLAHALGVILAAFAVLAIVLVACRQQRQKVRVRVTLLASMLVAAVVYGAGWLSCYVVFSASG